MRAERRRTEQKQEEERRQAAVAVARLAEVVGEWRNIIGHSIIIQGSNGVPVEVVVKRVSDNGYLCIHVTGNTPPDNPGIWIALASVQMLDDLVDGTTLGLSQFEKEPGWTNAAKQYDQGVGVGQEPRPVGASEDANGTQKPAQKRAPRKKQLTEPAAIE